jgi:HK97 family phage prohead protease
MADNQHTMKAEGEGLERRIAPGGIEIRQLADGKPRLKGYAAVFNSRSLDLGGFVEVIRPGAFTRSLNAGTDVRAFVEHTPSLIIGRRSAGTLNIGEDARGLRVEITPPDTQAARDLAANIRAGNLDGMSFSFRVAKGGEAWDVNARPPLRELLDVDLREVSVCALPAYPETAVALRSLEALQRDRAYVPRPGRCLADLQARQRFVEAEIRQADVDAEVAADRDLLRRASPLAWHWARSFRAGTAWPENATEAQRIGWALARRGYDHAPVWLKAEMLQKQMKRP